jgi:hypothetical protein
VETGETLRAVRERIAGGCLLHSGGGAEERVLRATSVQVGAGWRWVQAGGRCRLAVGAGWPWVQAGRGCRLAVGAGWRGACDCIAGELRISPLPPLEYKRGSPKGGVEYRRGSLRPPPLTFDSAPSLPTYLPASSDAGDLARPQFKLVPPIPSGIAPTVRSAPSPSIQLSIDVPFPLDQSFIR